VGRLVLWIFGWRVEGELPADPKLVLIAAPHTSGWDGVFMLAVAWTLGVRLAWMGKRSLFRGWRGPFLRRWGGIPVDREAPTGLVGTLVEAFAAAPTLALAIPPSGTRARANHWRSGFYHIALAAKVPIVCAYLDYARKVAGLAPAHRLSGNVSEDMDRIRTVYASVTAKYPEKVTPVRLLEERESCP
jgi:1-acyl-sn-glycerol-3-phosphate acyltransferase